MFASGDVQVWSDVIPASAKHDAFSPILSAAILEHAHHGDLHAPPTAVSTSTAVTSSTQSSSTAAVAPLSTSPAAATVVSTAVTTPAASSSLSKSPEDATKRHRRLKRVGDDDDDDAPAAVEQSVRKSTSRKDGKKARSKVRARNWISPTICQSADIPQADVVSTCYCTAG